jgi:hypothetical protein
MAVSGARYCPSMPKSGAGDHEEKVLRVASPVLGQLVDVLKKREVGNATRRLRQLHRLYLDYPTQALVRAVELALVHGLYDLERIESMLLRQLAGTLFRLDVSRHESPNALGDDPDPYGGACFDAEDEHALYGCDAPEDDANAPALPNSHDQGTAEPSPSPEPPLTSTNDDGEQESDPPPTTPIDEEPDHG